MTDKEKAKHLTNVFGKDTAIKVVGEMLENNEACKGRYRTDYDRVCIRQYWLDVKKQLH